jgi:hypothetical protein
MFKLKIYKQSKDLKDNVYYLEQPVLIIMWML